MVLFIWLLGEVSECLRGCEREGMRAREGEMERGFERRVVILRVRWREEVDKYRENSKFRG